MFNGNVRAVAVTVDLGALATDAVPCYRDAVFGNVLRNNGGQSQLISFSLPGIFTRCTFKSVLRLPDRTSANSRLPNWSCRRWPLAYDRTWSTVI